MQENTTTQVMELNKTIQDLKMEVDTIKKTKSEATLETETLGKKSGTIDASISNIIQEMEERISGAEDSIENIGTTIKENGKFKKILTQKIQEIQDTMRRPNLWIIGVDENEDVCWFFELKNLHSHLLLLSIGLVFSLCPGFPGCFELGSFFSFSIFFDCCADILYGIFCT